MADKKSYAQTYLICRSPINRIIPVNNGSLRINDTNAIGPWTYLFNEESYISFQKSSIMINNLDYFHYRVRHKSLNDF